MNTQTTVPNPPVNYYLGNLGNGQFKVRGTQQVNVSGQTFLLVPGDNGFHELKPFVDVALDNAKEVSAKADLKFTTTPEGTMFRIIAARDIEGPEGAFVTEGEEGGLIYAPEALTQRGRCWVERDAKITGGYVRDDARICDDAVVSGGIVFGNAAVCDQGRVEGGNVFGNATISDDAVIRGGNVFGLAEFSGNAVVKGGSYSDGFAAGSGTFGANRYEGPELTFGHVPDCEDEDGDGEDNDWLADILQSNHLLALATRYGTLMVYRIRHKHTAALGYRLQVGCQRRRLSELEAMADRYDANEVERAMIPGFVAMASALVTSWGVEL